MKEVIVVAVAQIPPLQIIWMNPQRKRNLFPLSSDSEGLVGTPKKRRALVRMMHNYSKSPRKLARTVVDVKNKNKQLKDNLRTVKMRTGRLKKKVQHLHDIVTELKRLRLLSGIAREVLEKSYSGTYVM